MSAVVFARAVLCVAAWLCLGRVAAGEPETLAQRGDAYVTHDPATREWTIGTREVAYAVRLIDGKTFGVSRLASSDGAWAVDGAPDATFVAGSRQVSLGSSTFTFESFAVDEFGHGLRLALTFTLADQRLRVTRYYTVYPRAPALETWLRFQSTGGPGTTVSDVGVWQLGVAADGVRWVTGLSAPAAEGGSFTRREQALAVGGRIVLSATGRSSESVVPVVWLTSNAGQLATGLMWSGEWAMTLSRPGARLSVRVALGQLSTAVRPDSPFDTPHAFLVLTPGGTAEATRGLADFILRGVRGGRPLPSLVTYNTWFAYGIDISEEVLIDEMTSARDLGADLFVLDAGWYPGGTRADDFSTGLGTWQTDTRKLPNGLPYLVAAAHERGLLFGLWVEPERVAMSTVNRPGLARERFLAQTGGRYSPGVTNAKADAAQICLADAEARDWVLQRLFQLLDEVRPDYLKWDNNYWINCDRTDHGHGAKDGNFAHVTGLYSMLEELRTRYPDMLIENCSGGGNRLDLGMLRRTDAGWMDDRSTPASRVRHNLQGLAAVFPPAYLLSFIMAGTAESLQGAPDWALVARSRMPGAVGMSLRGGEFDESDLAQLRTQIDLYKSVRRVLARSSALLLTNQVQEGAWGDWDVLQSLSTSGNTAVLFAVRGETAAERETIRPYGLSREATYLVTDEHGGTVGHASGAQLMDEGITFSAPPASASHFLKITRVPSGGTP